MSILRDFLSDGSFRITCPPRVLSSGRREVFRETCNDASLSVVGIAGVVSTTSNFDDTSRGIASRAAVAYRKGRKIIDGFLHMTLTRSSQICYLI